MGILVGKGTRVLVQGITGAQGSFHTKLMLEYGTKIVAGVTPGKGGTEVQGVPVFDTAEEATDRFKANASIIFVPAPFAKDAALENIAAGFNPVVVITEGLPVKDEIQIMEVARLKGTTIIGPNTPGIITPGECKARDHARPHLQTGQGWFGLKERHADLRNRGEPDSRRTGTDNLPRDRWGSSCRIEFR